MDYDGLKASLQSWSERTYSDPQLDEFIDLAEASIRRQLVGYQREVTGTLTADTNGDVALPADFLGMRSVYYGDVPYRYNISGSTLSVVDGGGYAFDVTYFAKLPALEASNLTNWLIDEAPDAYLFMCRAYQAAFEEDPSATAWESKASSILSDYSIQNTIAQYARTGLRLPVAP